MWVPTDTGELRRAVEAGLHESPWLDGKRQPGESVELAKDVAAMANEGGLLLFGVDQDDTGKLIDLMPIDDLARTEERIATVVRDLVHNPPALHVRLLEDPKGSGAGYLAVVVPRSPLAPHMVEGRKEGRYYGRTGTTTKRLTGADVEQLLMRRRATVADADQALESAGRWLHMPPSAAEAPGRLTVLVEPIVPSGQLVHRASGARRPVDHLPLVFERAVAKTASSDSERLLDPTRRGRWLIGADRFFTGAATQSEEPVEHEVSRDGVFVHRSVGNVIQYQPSARQEAVSCCNEWQINGYVATTIAAAGVLLGDADEFGQVRCSIGLDGLFGVRSLALENARATTGRLVLSSFAEPGLVESRYVRHVEASALELLDDPQGIAQGLLGELFEALAQGDYPAGASPFPE